MTETSAVCVTGCTTRGQHTSDCGGGECRSCRPRPASFGRLCSWCWQRLNADVVDSPGLVEHLRAEAEPDAAAAPPSDTRGHSDPAEGSVLSAAIDAADELHACLASWAQEIVDKHPANLTGPSEAGGWRSQTSTRVDHETGEVYLSESRVIGFHDPAATAALVNWLLPHLAWASEQDWAGEMRNELGEMVGTTKARWPMEERSRPVLNATCSDCHRASLVLYPPAYFKAQLQVACSHHECGKVYDEREWGMLTRLIEHEHRMAAAREREERGK